MDPSVEKSVPTTSQTFTMFGQKHDEDHKLKITLPRSLGQTLLATEGWKYRPHHDQDIRVFQRKPDDPSFWVELTSIGQAMEPDQVYAHVQCATRTMDISVFGNILKLKDVPFPCTGRDVLLRLAQMPLDMSKTCLVMKPYDMNDKMVIVTPDTALIFASDSYHLGVRTLKRKADDSASNEETSSTHPPTSKSKK